METEIILDTETTGLDPAKGHRVIEIGAIKLKGRTEIIGEFHEYINPKRNIPKESFEVHGISEEFLRNKPTFDKIAKKFLDFIGKAKIVAHNAIFDVRFLNSELAALGYNEISKTRIIDTLKIAREKFPGAPASLDALCKKYGVDLEMRQKHGHGALLDAKLLLAVYCNLMRKNNVINFGCSSEGQQNFGKQKKIKFPYRKFELNEEDHIMYQKMVAKLTKK